MKFAAAFALFLLLPFGRPAFAQQETPDQPLAVEGMARTDQGQPAANITLYISCLVPSRFPFTSDRRHPIVTDAAGHFTWLVPENRVTEIQALSSKPGSLGCFVLASNSGWMPQDNQRDIGEPDDADEELELRGRDAASCHYSWSQTSDAPAAPELNVTVPTFATVDVALSDPAGNPLVAKNLYLTWPSTKSWDRRSSVYHGQTNAQGHLLWRCLPGSRRLLFAVPGIGYGSTGSFAAAAGETVLPRVPRLAPFASVVGSVPIALCGPWTRVTLATYFDSSDNSHAWWPRPLAPDESGKFQWLDVLPGHFHLAVRNPKYSDKVAHYTIHEVQLDTTAGHQTVAPQFQCRPDDPKPTITGTQSQPANYPKQAAKYSLQGTVTHVGGQPGANVPVYALFSTQSRRNILVQTVMATTTGQDGRYIFSDLAHIDYPNIVVFALPERGGSVAYRVNLQKFYPPPVAELRADLILPPRSTSLRVRFTHLGKPIAGVQVSLASSMINALANLSGTFKPDTPEHQRVARVMSPQDVSAADGIVTFPDLIPGIWRLTAAPASKGLNDVTGVLAGLTTSIAVRPAQVTAFNLQLSSRPAPGVWKVYDPEQSVPPASPVRLFAIGPYYGGDSLSLKMDGFGRGTFDFPGAGLWQTHVTAYRPNAASVFPSGTTYEAVGIMAISPAIPSHQPNPLRPLPVQTSEIKVQVRDSWGQPGQGAVSLIRGDGEDGWAAEVDERGEANFADMEPGVYLARFDALSASAAIAGFGFPQPLPSDSSLTGKACYFPQSVTAKASHNATLQIRPQAACYVRGQIVAAEGISNYSLATDNLLGEHVPPRYWPRQWSLDLSTRQAMPEAACGFDPANGRFLAGPFPPGIARFALIPGPGAKTHSPTVQRVALKSGRVTTINLSPPGQNGSELPFDQRADALMAKFLREGEPRPTKVVLSDGITPAWGAHAILSVPYLNNTGAEWATDSWRHCLMARSDAAGFLSLTQDWYRDARALRPQAPAGPAELIVWIPGTNGAAIVPAAQAGNATIVLPPAITLHGYVTVAGKNISSLSSEFLVRAGHQGRAKLDQLLSVSSRAQPDGSFQLIGLTPGTYLVQAARDGIWLSASQTITVNRQGVVAPSGWLHLDIGGPGKALDTVVRDAAGHTLPFRSVSLQRPTGPLTDDFWPPSFETDAAGVLHLEGLEAGVHRLQITPQRIVDLRVPPLESAAP